MTVSRDGKNMKTEWVKGSMELENAMTWRDQVHADDDFKDDTYLY
jgi:hypothetical protein